MLQSINLQKYNNVQFYFTAIVIIVCLYFTIALLFDLFQIHIYRHDAAYYRTMEEYFDNLKTEGRWINYLLYPVYSAIPGKLATFLDLLFLFLFTLFVCDRWTKRFSYALLLSLLVIQVTPLIVQVMWPATILPAFIILFLAVLVSSYIPVYLFYSLFGILLFGSMSNLYYLLPLVHLSLLSSSSIKQNFRVLLFKLIPAWALGFVVGYIFLLLMTYALSGQFGIQIADWRDPNYIDSYRDLRINTSNSFSYMHSHVAELFTGAWRKVMMATALLIGYAGTNKNQYIPVVVLSFAIIVVHYVVTLPIGVIIDFRTAIMTWIGVLVIFFFFTDIKKWQYYLLLPIILFMTLSFYRTNHESLNWYSSITNIYHDELLRASPLQPELYKGLIFLSTSAEVEKMNSMISSKLNLDQGKMEKLDADFRWLPVAREAGFKKVIYCNTRHRYKKIKLCKKILENNNAWPVDNIHTSGLYRVLGQQDGFLIISLNDQIDL